MSDSDPGKGCHKWTLFLGIDGVLLLLLVVGILFFSAFGPIVTLTCARQDTSDVFCTYHTFGLGGSMGSIGVVLGGVNDQRCDWSGCRFRAVLETTGGMRPLTNEYTPGSKADFVDRLNMFIADKSQTSVELTQSPDLSGLLPPGLAVGLAVFGAGLVFWGYRLRRKITT